jgi:hypothetical protein
MLAYFSEYDYLPRSRVSLRIYANTSVLISTYPTYDSSTRLSIQSQRTRWQIWTCASVTKHTHLWCMDEKKTWNLTRVYTHMDMYTYIACIEWLKPWRLPSMEASHASVSCAARVQMGKKCVRFLLLYFKGFMKLCLFDGQFWIDSIMCFSLFISILKNLWNYVCLTDKFNSVNSWLICFSLFQLLRYFTLCESVCCWAYIHSQTHT